MKISEDQTFTMKQVVKTICDQCGEEIQKGGSYDVFSSEMKQETGEVYPEGGYRTVIYADFCQECSRAVIAALESHGIKFHTEEIEVL